MPQETPKKRTTKPELPYGGKPTRAKKETPVRFDPDEVGGLVDRAKAGDQVARDELVLRFSRLISSLVHLCLTGRINPRSTSQKALLKMFASKTTALPLVAGMLRKELSPFSKEEIYMAGEVAILHAVALTKKNFAASVVIAFKNEIYSMIRSCRAEAYGPDESMADPHDMAAAAPWQLFLQALSPEDRAVVDQICDGEDVEIPHSLRTAAVDHLVFDGPWDGSIV